MKRTKQQVAAERFASKTARIEAGRIAQQKLADHRARRRAEAKAQAKANAEAKLAEAQAAWDADHPRKVIHESDSDPELVAAAEDLGIDLSGVGPA